MTPAPSSTIPEWYYQAHGEEGAARRTSDTRHGGAEQMSMPATSPQPYSMPLRAGFSMISFPGQPLHPELGAVFPPEVVIVLEFRNNDEDWRTAIRGEDDDDAPDIDPDEDDTARLLTAIQGREWAGRLTEVEAGYGYWVMAVSDCTIEVDLLSTPAVPPPLSEDWNLIGIIDPGLSAAGEHTAELLTMDEYLPSGWAVAYTVDGGLSAEPADELFAEIKPLSGHELLCGVAYWVFVGDGDDAGDPPSISEWFLAVGDVDSRSG